MLIHRSGQERGYASHGWLESYHTFSFAHYYDPNHLGFRSLRVINEDRIQGGAGFPTHYHRDMEIITYVIEGRLQHQDSLGNGSIIERGKIQRMSAGTGINHSEYNASETEIVHLLQVWIVPSRTGLPPSYEEKTIDLAGSRGKFQTLATSTGRHDTLTIHQDMTLAVAQLDAGGQLPLPPQNFGWLQIVKGALNLENLDLVAGDGIAIMGSTDLVLGAQQDSEVLLFTL